VNQHEAAFLLVVSLSEETSLLDDDTPQCVLKVDSGLARAVFYITT
jgi:hypothetical protein